MFFKAPITTLLFPKGRVNCKRTIPSAKDNMENAIKSKSNSMHSKASKKGAPQQTTFQYHSKPKRIPPTIIKKRISDFKEFSIMDSPAQPIRWSYFPKYTSDKERELRIIETFSIKEAIKTKLLGENCSIRAVCNLSGDTANGIRDVISLPNYSLTNEKKKKFIIILNNDSIKPNSATEDDLVGSMDIINSILSSNINLSLYSALYATPDMIIPLTKVARILGPLGMMPNLKTGTLTNDLAASIQKGRHEEAFMIKKDLGVFEVKIASKDIMESAKIEENFQFCLKYLLGKGVDFIDDLMIVFSKHEGNDERVLKINPSLYKGENGGQKYVMALEKCRAAAIKRGNSYLN